MFKKYITKVMMFLNPPTTSSFTNPNLITSTKGLVISMTLSNVSLSWKVLMIMFLLTDVVDGIQSNQLILCSSNFNMDHVLDLNTFSTELCILDPELE